MICIGIDNGKSGAIAIIDIDVPEITGTNKNAYKVVDMPLIGKEYDIGSIYRILRVYEDEANVCLESAQVMPGQGACSGFTIGKNYGIIQGVLTAVGMPYEIITPKKWQKEFGISSDIELPKVTKEMTDDQKKECNKERARLKAERKKEIKSKSVLIAQRLFPGINFTTPRGALKDGWSDAILMAEYCRRQYGTKK